MSTIYYTAYRDSLYNIQISPDNTRTDRQTAQAHWQQGHSNANQLQAHPKRGCSHLENLPRRVLRSSAHPLQPKCLPILQRSSHLKLPKQGSRGISLRWSPHQSLQLHSNPSRSPGYDSIGSARLECGVSRLFPGCSWPAASA